MRRLCYNQDEEAIGVKDLMTSNIYEASGTVLIVGSCLPAMQPEGFALLRSKADCCFALCLEQTHINMAIPKLGGMLYTGQVRRMIFATVDGSPHCVQMHYIQNELRLMMDLADVAVENYVVVENRPVRLTPEVILRSKKLSALAEGSGL